MACKVLIAHAEGEEELAEKLAAPLRQAGYEVAHRGTVLVGESVIEEASKVLATGGPVVVCGTIQALGTGWAHRLVNAARRSNAGARVFAVRMEEGAYLEQLSLDGTVAEYWQDPAKAIADLVEAIRRYYPLEGDAPGPQAGPEVEQRYRHLALESCDIIDLANLPESDRHLAARQLELRRLYVPLRLRVEVALGSDVTEEQLLAIELRRETGRLGSERPGPDPERIALGECLGEARRFILLGDPGAGKTTLLRWLATAYLLRLKGDPDWQAIPDVTTLPDEDWLPIIIRCRDLDASCLGGSLEDMLDHALRAAELTATERTALKAYLLARLREGSALLLVDGLDEITGPALRIRFCQQLEKICNAYPSAPVIATSRVVGYREIGYHIGRGFQHLTVADLSKEDKDDFAQRWCALVETPERRQVAATELIHDIHSSDRIERLAGNPMLLTTLALVKRKVGKLPSRRSDLYREAVQVLLHWRSEVDEPVDPREALPQLQYLAYAMCDRGVQQLREDDAITLLEQMRTEYPQVRAAQAHTPEEFLHLLERRTAIVMEAGQVRHLGQPVRVLEFRHLTFQEYLAARALVEGRFPGRDRARSLAQTVAPLVARTIEVGDESGDQRTVAAESMRETIRLCVAICSDDEVDELLLGVLRPLPDENQALTARPRALLAALCLADEPNAGEATARAVLEALAPDAGDFAWIGRIELTVVPQLATSVWLEVLQEVLGTAFCQIATPRERSKSGLAVLCDRVSRASAPEDEAALWVWLEAQAPHISSGGARAVAVALGVLDAMARGRGSHVPILVGELVHMLARGGAESHAAAWALGWAAGPASSSSDRRTRSDPWRPSEEQLISILAFARDPDSDAEAVRFLTWVLGKAGDPRAREALLALVRSRHAPVRGDAARMLGGAGDARDIELLIGVLSDPEGLVRESAAQALGDLGDPRAVEPLIAALSDLERGARHMAACALGAIRDQRAVEPLIGMLSDREDLVRRSAAQALGAMGDARAVEPLIDLLRDHDGDVWVVALGALWMIGGPRANAVVAERLSHADEEVRRDALGGPAATLDDRADRELLSVHLHGYGPWLDPAAEVDEARVLAASRQLQLAPDEVRRRYEELAKRFGLKLAWKQ